MSRKAILWIGIISMIFIPKLVSAAPIPAALESVPEFTTIGAGLAILGSAAYTVYRRRHRK